MKHSIPLVLGALVAAALVVVILGRESSDSAPVVPPEPATVKGEPAAGQPQLPSTGPEGNKAPSRPASSTDDVPPRGVGASVAEGAADAVPELPSFAELPPRLQPKAMNEFGAYFEGLLDERLPTADAQVDSIDCSAVPCLLRVSTALQLPGEKPSLPTVVGLATDSSGGDRPIVVQPGNDDRQRAVISFVPKERPELAAALRAAAEQRVDLDQ